MSGGAYQLSDVVLASSMALPELEAVAAEPQWTFDLRRQAFPFRRSDWFQRWRLPNGRPSASFAREAGGYLVRFHGMADFSIDLGSRTIACWRRGTTPLTTIRHLLLDQVMPLVLSRGPRLVLHAAAVDTPKGAVALVGPAGSGKSTLASALAVAGLPLLTDDCLLVEPATRGFIARSFYPGARLWPDSARALGTCLRSSAVAHYTRKRRVASLASPSPGESFPLSRLLVLSSRRRARAPRTDVALTPLGGREALLSLLGCTFQLDLADRAVLRRGFELLSSLVAETQVHSVEYPWKLVDLTQTSRQLLDWLGSPAREANAVTSQSSLQRLGP